MKRARFNAAKRCERRQHASVFAFALVGVFGFVVPYYLVLFNGVLSPHTKNIVEFTSFVVGALSLILGLIELAKDYPAKARRFEVCGRKVNSVLRRLIACPPNNDAEIQALVDQYERALEECSDNHDDIDFRIAKALQAVLETPGADKGKAQAALAHARWLERLHVYGLYLAVSLTPLLVGIALWLFLPPPQ